MHPALWVPAGYPSATNNRKMLTRPLLATLVAFALVACSSGPGQSTASMQAASPAPRAEPATPTCAVDDHLLQDRVLGWAFCYPTTWRFFVRSQTSQTPKGVDLTLDISDAGASGDEKGQFAFVIIGTYERAHSASLQDWMSANHVAGQLDPITWGDALEAGQVHGTNRLFALTPHQVVELDIRAGRSRIGQQLADRLATWRFSY